MAQLYFPINLSRQVECPDVVLNATTVRELFDCYFADYPKVRSYVLDDQGAVRKHVNVIVDGTSLQDRDNLSDSISNQSEVYIIQALSGG